MNCRNASVDRAIEEECSNSSSISSSSSNVFVLNVCICSNANSLVLEYSQLRCRS
jgi:hypothetical protein